jgi:HlyD family secretion protein
VWTVEGGTLRQHSVTLGHRLLDGRYEITGGVPSGAAVVTELTGRLREGRAAKIDTKIEVKAAGGKAP